MFSVGIVILPTPDDVIYRSMCCLEWPSLLDRLGVRTTDHRCCTGNNCLLGN